MSGVRTIKLPNLLFPYIISINQKTVEIVPILSFPGRFQQPKNRTQYSLLSPVTATTSNSSIVIECAS